MKTTVIFHSADYDGIFCREIGRHFLPEAEIIGWDFGNPLIPMPETGPVYILDLSPDCLLVDFKVPSPIRERIVWIDHHKSSIEKWPKDIPGYRIDGVAACRLAWQWFTMVDGNTRHGDVGNSVRAAGVLPMIQDYKQRSVNEPLAVRLAGEYDVWDHRGDGDVEFQFGLDSVALTPVGWDMLLNGDDAYTESIVQRGEAARACYAKRDADVMRTRSFLVTFEGLKFLALNTPRCNSNTFAAMDNPEIGHDALMGFYFNGKKWTVSLYHARHKKHLDLSKIAVKYGGGGHKGACGFVADRLPFLNLGL